MVSHRPPPPSPQLHQFPHQPTSTRRRRDDGRRWLGLRLRVPLAPQPGQVALEVADGRVAPALARHLAPDAAVDGALAPLAHRRQVAAVRRGRPRPGQHLGDVGQGLAPRQFVAARAAALLVADGAAAS